MRPFVSIALLSLVFCVGCSSKPRPPLEYDKEVVCKRLNTAGYVAAVVSLKASKVDHDADLSRYVVVLDTIREVMVNMPSEGFIAILPAVQEAIANKYGEGHEEAILIGAKLAQNLLEEAEELIIRNPKWLEKRDDLADMLASFLKGAKEGIEAYGGDR